LQSQQWQKHLHIDGNSAIATRAMMPAQQQATRATMLAQQQRRRLCINEGKDTIRTRATITTVTTAKMPAHQWQQHHHDEGDNASLTTSNKGKKASLKTAEMPVHQQWQ
jgi:hypothetical protein